MQERRNSIANTLELRLSCTNPSKWYHASKFNDTKVYSMWLPRADISINNIHNNKPSTYLLLEDHQNMKEKKNRENISILQWWKPNKAPGDLKLQSSWRCWFSCDLTHWGWVTHICISKLTIISSDNGLAPTDAAILLIGPVRTNFSEIVIKTQTFSLKKIHVKVSFGKWQPFCLALNVSIVQ